MAAARRALRVARLPQRQPRRLRVLVRDGAWQSSARADTVGMVKAAKAPRLRNSTPHDSPGVLVPVFVARLTCIVIL